MSYRLTNEKRESIVRSIMSEVPEVDYSTKITDRVKKLNVTTLPDKLKDIGSDPELSKWLNTTYIHTFTGSDIVFSPSGYKEREERCKQLQQDKKIKEWSDLAQEQHKSRRALEKRLTTQISTVNTSKQLKERFPEFIKHLPDHITNTPNLPADNSLITDLVKAGWPDKNKKKK